MLVVPSHGKGVNFRQTSELPEGPFRLEDVRLRGSDDEPLGEIATISSLHCLSLMGSSVSDEGLQHLKQLKELVALDLKETDVPEAGVAALKNALPNCEIHYREDDRGWSRPQRP